MGPDNMIDTRPFAGFLKTYAETLRPRSRGVTRGIGTRGLVSLGVQVFERGSYTVVLAREANIADIRQALDALPETKHPEIADALIESFAELYPGWHLAICCWSGNIKPEPLLWWFEPAFEDVFLPGLDAHDGGPPNLHALVDTDHTLVVGDGHTIAGHGREHGVVQVRTPDHVPAEARSLFPSGITGLISSTRIPNGDWWADERHWNIRRERPDGKRRISIKGSSTADVAEMVNASVAFEVERAEKRRVAASDEQAYKLAKPSVSLAVLRTSARFGLAGLTPRTAASIAGVLRASLRHAGVELSDEHFTACVESACEDYAAACDVDPN